MVDFIKIAGKEHPVSVCWGAICEFCELIGINKLTEMQRLMEASPIQITQFLWICLWYGAKADGHNEPDVKPEDLLVLVDQKCITDFITIVGKRLSSPAEDEGDADGLKKKN